MQMTRMLHQALQRNPDRVLTIFGTRTRTVAESRDRIARFAAVLRELGVSEGDRVGLMALNSDKYHEYLLAVPWAGAVVNPVNIRWSPVEVAYSLNDCDTRVLLVDDMFAPLVPTLMELSPVLTTVVFCGEGACPEGMLDLESLMAKTEPMADAERRGDDLYGVFYTGGTTGFPKGVMVTHAALLSTCIASQATSLSVTIGGRLLNSAPMFHLGGITFWLPGMLQGSTLVFLPMFTPAGVISAITDLGVNDALLMPTMLQMLLDAPEAATADLSSLKKVVYGASSITPVLLDRARAALPNAGFTQAYGMTELSPLATILTDADHADPVLRTSAGRAVMQIEVLVVDENDNELPRGEVGEIIVRGANVMKGYWNKPEQTAEALRGGWMHTGDLGRMDDQGYVYIVDRLKDMIISGGENIYSAEVENAIAQHPGVSASAVIGVPDEKWGERVHAVIIAKPGVTLTFEEIQAHCREYIAGYKCPRSASFVDSLPLSAAGKVLKRTLRDEYSGE